jgi:hypothetical protein
MDIFEISGFHDVVLPHYFLGKDLALWRMLQHFHDFRAPPRDGRGKKT